MNINKTAGSVMRASVVAAAVIGMAAAASGAGEVRNGPSVTPAALAARETVGKEIAEARAKALAARQARLEAARNAAVAPFLAPGAKPEDMFAAMRKAIREAHLNETNYPIPRFPKSVHPARAKAEAAR